MQLITQDTPLHEAQPDDLDELRLDGQVALVTGGAQGMGREIAHVLGRRGARIALFDLKTDGLTQGLTSLGEAGVEAVGLAADVTGTEDVAEAVDYITARWQRLDVLVNCAGVAGVVEAVKDIDDAGWQQTIAINLTGTFKVSRAVVPVMLERGYGRIVNVASIAGKEGNPNASDYSASKAGVIALTKSLGKELATSGVLVNAIAPAVIETPMVDDVSQAHLEYMVSKIPMGRMGTTAEIARLVAFLASSQLTYSTGATYDISGGRATY